MRIEELSVGDWVRHTFYEENLQIKRIDGESERLLVEKGQMSVSCHLDHFEPIPITAEILAKNGWYDLMKLIDDDEDDDASYRAYCDWELEPNICGTIYEVGGKFHLGDSATYHKFLELQYVHQLQHALRLAGEEKEIEL